MIRFSLTLEDFEKLIRGKTINKEGVEFYLQDIGYPIIEKAILEAIKEFNQQF